MNFGLRQDARVTSRSHLSQTRGILQADGYKGYAKLYDPGPDGSARFREAACWAHLRRDFHDVWTSTGSEIAREALDWIGALYDIERDITGKPADVRRAARQAHSLPKVEAFRAWAELQLTRLPGKGDLAKAFRYSLSRWPSFCLFLKDGRVGIDADIVEHTLSELFSTRLGLGRPVPPSFDHARIGSLGICDQFHFMVADLLDPVVASGTRLVGLGFRNTCTEVELAHLHGHEGRARPPVGFLLAQQRPDQRGDLARGGDACNVLALAPRVHHTGHS